MITLSHISKQYDTHTVLHDLSFTVHHGQIVGLLGPNGAGKTTTMNILTGCLAPSSGSISVYGVDLLENPREAKRHLGYLPEQPPLYPDMTVREYLDFVAEAKGVSRRIRTDAVTSVMKATDVLHEQNRLLYKLSKGTRQRVGIAQALLGEPDCIVLDEPTIGLDPRQITEIRALIGTLGKKRTILISSHILSEIDALCDQVLILSHGKLVAQDTPENLTHHLRPEETLTLLVRCDESKLRQVLGTLDCLTSTHIIPDRKHGILQATLSFERVADPRELVSSTLASYGIYPLELRMDKPQLEDVFLELTGDDTVGKEVE